MKITKRQRLIGGGLLSTATITATFLLMTATNDISLPPGGDLQAAINSVPRGASIILQADADYYCNCRFPIKDGEEFISIKSSREAEITPRSSSSELYARVHSLHGTEPAFSILPGAHHFKLIGLDIRPSATEQAYSIVRIGSSGPEQDDLSEVPHHIELDRVIVQGGVNQDVQAGVTLNGAHVSITNSSIKNIHFRGVQSYGVGGFNGPGPFNITNNYIAAAGLNIIFGGSTPSIQNLVPSDIVIDSNHLHKRLEWKGVWTTVNLLELKNARRVRISNNFLENNWPDAQVGWAVIFNTFHDGGWEVGDDIQFINNIIRNSTNGINLSGMDTRDGDNTVRMHRILVEDNLLEELGFGGFEAKPFQVLNGSEDITINHNTVTKSTHSLTMHTALGFSHVRFKFTNNLIPHGDYGVFSDGGALGVDAMGQRATNWQMEQNAFVPTPPWADKSKYPNNYFPASLSEAAGLLGTDGKPVGVRGGTPLPSPTSTTTPTPSASPSPSPTPVLSEVTISGKLLKKDGTPLKGVRIMINPGVGQTFTKDDGSYSFKVKPGNYTVIAGASNSWWVYQPGYKAIKANQNSTADFTAIASNDLSLFP